MSYMNTALEEAFEGIRNGDGGPFGAVVVKDGNIIGQGHNRVLSAHDPTLHGEIDAIRRACGNIGSHDLTGCVLYTTAYPCPMCMCAAMWANVERIVYGCTSEDAAEIGFRDDDFYSAFRDGKNTAVLECEEREECLALFDEYRRLNGERY